MQVLEQGDRLDKITIAENKSYAFACTEVESFKENTLIVNFESPDYHQQYAIWKASQQAHLKLKIQKPKEQELKWIKHQTQQILGKKLVLADNTALGTEFLKYKPKPKQNGPTQILGITNQLREDVHETYRVKSS